MQVQVEDLSPVSKKLSFVVEADAVTGKLDEAYRTLGKQVQMKGFRPGKVPRRILEKRFGRHIEGEVGGQVISDAFDEAIEEHDITPVSQPIIEQGKLVKGEDYSFSVTIEIKPKLELKGWDGVDVEWERVELDETKVAEELDGMRQRGATVEAADEGHVAAEGDMVIVDGSFVVEGSDDPRKLEGLMVLAGQTTGMASADWLAPMVIGMKTGETKSETLTAPDRSLGEEWDGSEGALELTVTEIKVTRLPELDDDFAQDVGHDTLDLLKADLRFKLEEHARAHARGHASHNAIKAVIDANEFEAPQGLVKYQAEQSLKEQFQQFARQGMNIQLPTLDQLPQETQDGLLGDATFAVKQGLILEAIAEEVGIEITDEDLDGKIAEMAAEIGQQASAVKGLLLKNNGMEGLRSRLLEERALDTLLERANVIDVEPTDHSAHGHDEFGDHDHGDHDHEADGDHDHEADDDHEVDGDHDHADEADDQADEADDSADEVAEEAEKPADSEEG